MKFYYHFNSRREAEEVLCRMREIVDTYGVVLRADFYDLVGEECSYTDNKYGWYEGGIKSATIYRSVGKYILTLSEPIAIGYDVLHKIRNSYISDDPKSRTINVLVRTNEIEDFNSFEEYVRSILKSCPGDTINITIE